jgi:hypothetical protein
VADAKITSFSADTTPTVDDLVPTVNDPGGTPANKKVTIANLVPSFGAASARVDTSQTTASTSYTDLATTGPAVTVTISNNGRALVCLGALIANSSSPQGTYMSFAVSGATTVAANDNAAAENSSSVFNRSSYQMLVTGLTAGSNTFTAKYKVDGTTGTFIYRTISVIPL